MAAPAAYGSSQAWDWIWAVASAMPHPLTHCTGQGSNLRFCSDPSPGNQQELLPFPFFLKGDIHWQIHTCHNTLQDSKRTVQGSPLEKETEGLSFVLCLYIIYWKQGWGDRWAGCSYGNLHSAQLSAFPNTHARRLLRDVGNVTASPMWPCCNHLSGKKITFLYVDSSIEKLCHIFCH